MSSEPYTPSEDEFIDTYAENVRVFHPERPGDECEARDDARRFLARVRAEARREGAVEGWDRGRAAGVEDANRAAWDYRVTPNPYRIEAEG